LNGCETASKAFPTPDAKLLKWFNRQLEGLQQKPQPNPTELETLCLLRDALIKETKRRAPRRKRTRVPSRSEK
jgi:hypothetical protein